MAGPKATGNQCPKAGWCLLIHCYEVHQIGSRVIWKNPFQVTSAGTFRDLKTTQLSIKPGVAVPVIIPEDGVFYEMVFRETELMGYHRCHVYEGVILRTFVSIPEFDALVQNIRKDWAKTARQRQEHDVAKTVRKYKR